MATKVKTCARIGLGTPTLSFLKFEGKSTEGWYLIPWELRSCSYTDQERPCQDVPSWRMQSQRYQNRCLWIRYRRIDWPWWQDHAWCFYEGLPFVRQSLALSAEMVNHSKSIQLNWLMPVLLTLNGNGLKSLQLKELGGKPPFLFLHVVCVP